MKSLEEIQEALSIAIQMDLECGVRWMNEERAQLWVKTHPCLSKTLGDVTGLASITVFVLQSGDAGGSQITRIFPTRSAAMEAAEKWIKLALLDGFGYKMVDVSHEHWGITDRWTTPSGAWIHIYEEEVENE